MSDETNTTQTPNNNNDSGSSKTLIIILVIAAVVVLGIVAYLVFANKPASTPPGAVPTPIPPTVVVPAPPPDVPSVTATTAINVRIGPGTNYPAYGVAPQGAQAEVIGVSPDGGWWNIKVASELIPAGNAWVSNDYVTTSNTENVPVVEPPQPPPDAELPPADPNGPRVTALDAVNVRSGPGTEFPAYGVAPKGATGTVLGKSADGKWWAVEAPKAYTPDGMGWVSADWVLAENVEDVPVLP